MLDMKDMSDQNYNRYNNIIVSIVSSIVEQTDGVSNNLTNIRYRNSSEKIKNGNIHVYFKNDKIVIDVFINIVYGYNVPDIIAGLQNKIAKEVENLTKFVVESVNVNISNIIFN